MKNVRGNFRGSWRLGSLGVVGIRLLDGKNINLGRKKHKDHSKGRFDARMRLACEIFRKKLTREQVLVQCNIDSIVRPLDCS